MKYVATVIDNITQTPMQRNIFTADSSDLGAIADKIKSEFNFSDITISIEKALNYYIIVNDKNNNCIFIDQFSAEQNEINLIKFFSSNSIIKKLPIRKMKDYSIHIIQVKKGE